MFPKRTIGRASIDRGPITLGNRRNSVLAPDLSVTTGHHSSVPKHHDFNASDHGLAVPTLSRNGGALEGITDRMSKALEDFESLYDENGVESDALFTGISDHIDHMQSGEMKFKMKTFLNKYKDISREVGEVGRERDEILESLAEWFSMDRDMDMTLSYDGDLSASQSAVSDSMVDTKLGFEKLQAINREIVAQASRGSNTQQLKREKEKLQKKVVKAFKNNISKEKKVAPSEEAKSVDNVWKYAADEICGLLTKVRLGGADEMQKMEEKLKEVLSTLEKQQDKAASLEKNLLMHKKMMEKSKQENLELTRDISRYETKLDKLTKKYKKVCHSLAKYDSSMKKQLASVEKKEEDEEKAVGRSGGAAGGAEIGMGTAGGSFIGENADPMILKSRLKDLRNTIQRLETGNQELEKSVEHLKSDDNPIIKDLRDRVVKLEASMKENEGVIQTLQDENLELVHKLQMAEQNAEVAEKPEKFDGSLTGIAIRPQSRAVCHICGGDIQARMSSHTMVVKADSRTRQTTPVVSSDGEEVNELRKELEMEKKELEMEKKRVAAIEQQLAKAHYEINTLKAARLLPSAPRTTPMVDQQSSAGLFASQAAGTQGETSQQIPSDLINAKNIHSIQNQNNTVSGPATHHKKTFNLASTSVPKVEQFKVVDGFPSLDDIIRHDEESLKLYSPGPDDWVGLDGQVPVETSDHGITDMGDAMMELSAPDKVDNLVDLTTNTLGREIDRMVHGVSGFIEYATNLTQQQFTKMTAANTKLKRRLTDSQRKQLDKELQDHCKQLATNLLFPGLRGQHPQTPSRFAEKSLGGGQYSETPSRFAEKSLGGGQYSETTSRFAEKSLGGGQYSETPSRLAEKSLGGGQYSETPSRFAEKSLGGGQYSETPSRFAERSLGLSGQLRTKTPGFKAPGAAFDESMLNLSNDEMLNNFAALSIKGMSLNQKINKSTSVFRQPTGDVVRYQLEKLGDTCAHLLGGARNLLNFTLGKQQKEYKFIYSIANGPAKQQYPQLAVKTSRSHLGFVDSERDPSNPQQQLSPNGTAVGRITSASDMDLSKKPSRANMQTENEVPRPQDRKAPIEYKVPKAMLPKTGLIKLTSLQDEKKNPALYDDYLKRKEGNRQTLHYATANHLQFTGYAATNHKKFLGRRVKPAPLSHQKLMMKQKEIMKHKEEKVDVQAMRDEIPQDMEQFTLGDLQRGMLNFDVLAPNRRKASQEHELDQARTQQVNSEEFGDKKSQLPPLDVNTPRDNILPSIRT